MSERLASDIIECDGALVIKLFSPQVSRELVEEEVRLTNLARSLGILTPEIQELVQTSDRWGFSYHKINGSTIMDVLIAGERDIEELAMSFAQLHRHLHEHPGTGMPLLKDRLRPLIQEADLQAELKNKALWSLSDLPDGEWICHGDFHPGNVIMAQEGSYILDWVEASSGHYLADVARSLVLILAWLPNQLERMGASLPAHDLDRFHKVYRAHSFRSTPETEELLDRWTFTMAVARLCQSIPGEERRLRDLIDNLARR
ncbi:MAG: phosphotransferase [Methanomassiliicoccus sp.]|nr:phosphotransferase [Methanomassiliicoccus sp.]